MIQLLNIFKDLCYDRGVVFLGHVPRLLRQWARAAHAPRVAGRACSSVSLLVSAS